jgi:signal transduction histidine kinase
VSREIYDQLSQSLTILKIGTRSVERALLRSETQAVLEHVVESATNIDALMQYVRNIATELRPPLVDQCGLAAALEGQIQLLRKQHGLEIKLELPSSELTELQKISIFRIAQESLTNVMRHARATSASVRLWGDENSLRLLRRPPLH